MRYEKPIVMDLSAAARARGQGPLSCLSGDNPGGLNMCAAGVNPTTCSNTCGVGPAPRSGSGDINFCYTGPSANTICESGGSGYASFDDCTSGPTNVT
jgi:hypothetical protein